MLDRLDEQLLHALQVDGRASFSRIAAVLGVSDRTLARRYRLLRAAGAVRVVGLANLRAAGRVDWLVRIHCAPDAAPTIAAVLARGDDTAWVTLTSGGTEVTYVVRTTGGPLPRKLPQQSRIHAVTTHCILRPVAGTGGWPGRTAALTADQIALLRPAEADPASAAARTDADRALLAELAKDGRAPHATLAAATGVPESTVRRRLAELRRTGVLTFEVEIDPVLLGYTTEATLWLTVAPAHLHTVADALAGHTEIAFAAAITGPTNVFAFVVARDADALYDYLATTLGALPGVLQVDTALVTQSVKRAGTLLYHR